MVERFVTRYLNTTLVVAFVVFGLSPLAFGADGESGQAALERYRAAKTKQHEALAAGDRETYGAQEMEAASALSDAENSFRQQYERGGNMEDALGYARVLGLKGDSDLAAEVAGSALKDEPDSAALWREYGASLLKLGPDREQEGIDALYESLSRDKDSSEALSSWNLLAAYYLENALPEAAESALAGTLAIDGADVRAQMGMVVLDVYKGNVAAANDRLTSLGQAAQPFDTILRAQLRIALADFLNHRRSFSDTKENHFAYARLQYSAARFPEAVLAAQRAAHLAKDDTSIWNFLGVVQIQMGDYPGAQKTFIRSLEIDPNQPAMRQNLDQLNAELKGEGQAPAASEEKLGPLP